jgi:glucose-1-phosphate cytidylyltransferase
MNIEEIPVVILCGGKGTRLREETEYRPKAMVDVGGYPVLWHLMKSYARYGSKRFILCLGYKGEMIKEYFLNYRPMVSDFTVDLGRVNEVQIHGSVGNEDFRVTLANTGLDSMTGARVKRIERYVDTDIFMATYGDGLSDVNIADLLEFHRAHGRAATVTAVRQLSRYGVLDVTGDGRVRQFAEKPRLEGWINAGFFVFHRKIFDLLSVDENSVLEQEPLSTLARNGELAAFHHDGFFFAMDTYREYLQLNEMWQKGTAPWKTW